MLLNLIGYCDVSITFFLLHRKKKERKEKKNQTKKNVSNSLRLLRIPNETGNINVGFELVTRCNGRVPKLVRDRYWGQRRPLTHSNRRGDSNTEVGFRGGRKRHSSFGVREGLMEGFRDLGNAGGDIMLWRGE